MPYELLFGLLIPIVIGLLVGHLSSSEWRNNLSVLEYLALIAIVFLIAAGILFVLRNASLSSNELLSGEVTRKYKERVSCSHCHTECTARDRDGNCTSSREVCSHSYDQEWYVATNYGFAIEIPAVGQGLDAPQAWRRIQVGDHATSPHSFTNYLRVDAEANFPVNRDLLERYEHFIPPHPTEVHHYYVKTYRVIAVGFGVDEYPEGFSIVEVNGKRIVTHRELNERWSEAHKLLGPRKEANVNVIFVDSGRLPQQFAELVLGVWEGGGKNDVNVFIGAQPESLEIDWVEIQLGTGDAGNGTLIVQLSDHLLDLGNARDYNLVFDTIYNDVDQFFTRQEMKPQEYRLTTFHLRGAYLWLYYALVFLFTGIGAALFYAFDPFHPDS